MEVDNIMTFPSPIDLSSVLANGVVNYTNCKLECKISRLKAPNSKIKFAYFIENFLVLTSVHHLVLAISPY